MQPLAAPNRRPEILFRRFLDSEFPAAAPPRFNRLLCAVAPQQPHSIRAAKLTLRQELVCARFTGLVQQDLQGGGHNV